MQKLIHTIRGMHPGLFLERELSKRKIAKGRFALSLQEYPQTLVAITKGKRRMNPGIALKIEQELGLEEGFLLVLQTYHDIRKAKKKQAHNLQPNVSRFRPALFWDTDFAKINWNLHQNMIIRRVMERGNQAEKDEILRLYGEQKIARIYSPTTRP